MITCPVCSGSGEVQRKDRKNGTRLNDIKVSTVMGTKWTAVEMVDGWRHFVVIGKRGGGKNAEAELSSLCGGESERTKLFVNLEVRKMYFVGGEEGERHRDLFLRFAP